MTVSQALRVLACDARVKARLCEQLAGRLVVNGSRLRPLQVPSDRAREERKALAFYHAADVIERAAKEYE